MKPKENRFDAIQYIFLKFKPKHKICAGPHPSPYTEWTCQTCLENKGWNQASGQLSDILKSIVSEEEWEEICGSLGKDVEDIKP